MAGSTYAHQSDNPGEPLRNSPISRVRPVRKLAPLLGAADPLPRGLSRGFCLRNRGATSKVVIAKRRLPVPGHPELRTIQELRSIQESPGEVGSIEHRLEKVRAFQVGTRQVRSTEVRRSEIGAGEISPGKIVSAQVETSQTGLGQIWRLAVFRIRHRAILLLNALDARDHRSAIRGGAKRSLTPPASQPCDTLRGRSRAPRVRRIFQAPSRRWLQ